MESPGSGRNADGALGSFDPPAFCPTVLMNFPFASYTRANSCIAATQKRPCPSMVTAVGETACAVAPPLSDRNSSGGPSSIRQPLHGVVAPTISTTLAGSGFSQAALENSANSAAA